METNQKTILITGSNGLIGTALVERFAKKFAVVGFDLEPPAHPLKPADWIRVDLSSDASVQQGLQQVRERHGDQLASVIHLAAYYDFSGEPSDKYQEITVKGTGRLLRGLKSFQLEQFIFSSTMLVHAPCAPGERIHEHSPLQAKWAYPQSKIDTEELLRTEHGEIPLVLLRIAGVYNDTCHALPLANQIQRIHQRWLTSHVYPGDTSCGQAFLHLEDLLDAVQRLIERRQQLPKELTLLLGEPETISYEELQRTFGWLIHGEEWETRQIPQAVAKTGAWLQESLPMVEDPFIKSFMIDLADDHYELDISRARQVLGWEPRHNLRDALPKMVDAFQADPLRWYMANKLTPPEHLHHADKS